MSDSPEFVTTLSIIDNASKALERIEASARRVAGIFDRLTGLENSLNGFERPLENISTEMTRMADFTGDAERAVRDLGDSLEDVDKTSKKLSIGDIFKGIAANGANIFGAFQMASGLLNQFQGAVATIDANTNMIARLGAVARKEGIAMEDRDAWQGRAEEIRKALSAQAIDLGLDSTEYANNAITFANNPAFKSIEEASRFSELMSKQFFASGVGGQAQMSVVNQLTQGLSKGKLQGEDFMSILSNAPDVGKLLEEAYARMNNLDVDSVTGKVRELAGEGKLTADVIKDAFLGAADAIEANFEEMPNTFEDMLTKFRNTVLESFQPLMQLMMRIGNSDSFKSMLGSLSSIIGSVINVADTLSPVLELVLVVASKLSEVADVWLGGILAPFQWLKGVKTKESPTDRIAIDQRMRIYQAMEKQIDLLRDNSAAIDALADIQKTFNERTKGLFSYDKDLDKRQEEWLKDYQRSHVEETIGMFVGPDGLGGKSTFTNENVERMREQLYGEIQQGTIFNREQYKETTEQLKKANAEIERFAKNLRIAEYNANPISGNLSSERFKWMGVAEGMQAELDRLTGERDHAREQISLYNSRMNEWLKLIYGETNKTARNTRRVSINRDDLLFMRNIATAQIINNYNNSTNTTTANFNQTFGSGSPAQVRKAANDGLNKARRGSSSSMAG